MSNNYKLITGRFKSKWNKLSRCARADSISLSHLAPRARLTPKVPLFSDNWSICKRCLGTLQKIVLSRSTSRVGPTIKPTKCRSVISNKTHRQALVIHHWQCITIREKAIGWVVAGRQPGTMTLIIVLRSKLDLVRELTALYIKLLTRKQIR